MKKQKIRTSTKTRRQMNRDERELLDDMAWRKPPFGFWRVKCIVFEKVEQK